MSAAKVKFTDPAHRETMKNACAKWFKAPNRVEAMLDRDIMPAVESIVADCLAEELAKLKERWLHRDWADAPRRSDRVAERMANAQHVGDWLGDRANEYAPATSVDPDSGRGDE